MRKTYDNSRLKVYHSSSASYAYFPPQDILSTGTNSFKENFTMYSRPSAFGPPSLGMNGGAGGGGWDRYGRDGQKLGKCGDGKEGGAYAACLSQEKAAKLGPKGRAAFVRRKRAAEKKSGDAKKGGNRSKGKAPTNTKTGA